MKEIELFGLNIKDYSLKEAIECFKDFLRIQGVNLVSFISSEELIKTTDSEESREAFEMLDMVITAESFTGDRDKPFSRVDRKSLDFLETVLRSFAASKEGVYLICDSEENMQNLNDILEAEKKFFEGSINIMGRTVYDEITKEDMYNEINLMFPKLIISCTPWEMQGRLMQEGRKYLNSCVWLSILPSMAHSIQKGKVSAPSVFKQISFKRKLEKYDEESKHVAND